MDEKKAKKQPSLVGFKPTREDLKMLSDLLTFYKDRAGYLLSEKVTTTDVLKIAVRELHKSVFKESDEK